MNEEMRRKKIIDIDVEYPRINNPANSPMTKWIEKIARNSHKD